MTTNVASILQRMRDIHQVVPGVVETVSPALNWDDTEGRCLISATNQYSIDRPLRKVVISPGGEEFYLLSTIVPGWDGQVNRVERVQYPIAQNTANLEFLDSNGWRQTIDPFTGEDAIVFTTRPPVESFGLWYLSNHAIDYILLTSTIPTRHEEPVAYLGAALFLESVANKASNFFIRTPFGADGVDYSAIHTRYREAADRCRERYAELMSKDTPTFSPTFVDMDVDSPFGWRPFHPSELY